MEILRSFYSSNPSKATAGSALVSRYIHDVYRPGLGRSFISTREGYIGLAPRAATEGDVGSVLLGCGTPILLWPTVGGAFQIVGECLVYGFVRGEAVIGPFPDQ